MSGFPSFWSGRGLWRIISIQELQECKLRQLGSEAPAKVTERV